MKCWFFCFFFFCEKCLLSAKTKVFCLLFFFVLNLELKYKTLKIKTFNPKPGIFLFRNASFWNSSTTSLGLSVTSSCYFSTGLFSAAAAAAALVSSSLPPCWPLASCQAAFLDSPKNYYLPATGIC